MKKLVQDEVDLAPRRRRVSNAGVLHGTNKIQARLEDVRDQEKDKDHCDEFVLDDYDNDGWDKDDDKVEK
ncbi:hypothetical protein NDU88_003512 [Pleurodeles waltl]|uniref:Uncharacterized protein n=1 Tax=Pleurodeles waltl TaxID=8319 RepID=A0AAV7WT03_PLEWA|nr:hypothetical protein NDU88_003512 [Pleurodeles waltl]